ncbi:hypothetical protein PESP_b0182 [Pseudoalteromonas espejiana DSM 9414]|nr:hypothetical protein PESP_b0182 [Pseudoalteromonas espejiana DSM 9414]
MLVAAEKASSKISSLKFKAGNNFLNKTLPKPIHNYTQKCTQSVQL